MPEVIKTLVVDSVNGSAEELSKILRPEIEFAESEQVSSLYKALQALDDCYFGLCLISEMYGQNDLDVFFNDIKRLQKNKGCLFVQVRELIPENFDRSSLSDTGFPTIISRKGTFGDKEALLAAYNSLVHAKEVRKKITDVKTSMDLLLHELDRVADDRKRGRQTKFNSVPGNLVSGHTMFDPEVLDNFFEKLEATAAAMPAEEIEKLDIPEKLLKEGLPGLSKEVYQGVSRRVWQRLKKKYGVKRKSEETPK